MPSIESSAKRRGWKLLLLGIVAAVHCLRAQTPLIEVLAGDATLERARAVFAAALGRGVRLRAILVTASGKASAKVLGIVTAADLLES